MAVNHALARRRTAIYKGKNFPFFMCNVNFLFAGEVRDDSINFLLWIIKVH